MRHFKKITSVLFFGLCVFPLFLSAQSVFAPVKGAKWTYIGSATEEGSFNPNYRIEKFIIKAAYSKDTIVRTKVYKLIDLNTDVTGAFFGDTIRYHNQFANKLMVRQNADTIWALKDTATIERLFFVYTTGRDSFDMKIYPDVAQKTYIDSVGIFQVGSKVFKAWKGNSYLRLFLTDYGVYSLRKITFLDRIGPIDDQIMYAAYSGSWPNRIKNYPLGLVCYEDSEVGLVKFLNLDCDAPLVGTQDIAFQAASIKTWFNPSSQKLNISSDDINLSGGELALFNVNGQLLSTAALNGQAIQLSFSNHLSGGVYFVRFYNPETGVRFTKKALIYF